MYINNIKTIAILIIFNNFLFSLSTNISGFLFDSETNKPINNANIFIEKYEIGTISDSNGYFFLTVDSINQESVLINFQIIGYKEKKLLIKLLGKKIDLDKILIDKQPIKLETLHIHSHESSSSQISDIIISTSELNENIKGNIALTLSNYPNIGVNSFGSVTSKPALRGFSGDRFLLTKSGLETGDLSQSSIDHVITLDMYEVQQIEIIRGPKALIFGQNAIGGVVNTSLYGSPKFRVEKFHQKYVIGNESFNSSLYGNMMLYAPLGNNQINLLFSRKDSENETTSFGELGNTQTHLDNYKIGFTHYNKKGYINYSFEDFNLDYGIPANPNGLGHPIPVDIILNKKTHQFSFHQDILLSSFNQLDIKSNFIDYIHLEDIDGAFEGNDIFDIFNADDYHVGLSKDTRNFQIELSSGNSVLGLGYDRKHFKAYQFHYTPDTKESNFFIYGFKQKNFDSYELLYSFRLENLIVDPKTNDIQYNNLDPNDVKKRDFQTSSLSLGFRKKLNHIEFNSWVMQTMRAPRVEELYSDGPHLGTYSYELGNPNLDLEKIYGLENSISFNYLPYKISLVSFYNYSPYYHEMAKMGECEVPDDWNPWETHPCAGADFIEWGSGQFGFLYKYNSRGSETIIKGLELDFDYSLENFQLSYNLSFVDGYNKTLGRPLSYMNPMKQILSFDYNKNSIGYKIRFSKIHSQDKLGEFEAYTPGALLTDFIIDYNYKTHNIIIQLNNIFDNTYFNHLSRIKNITPEPGRNVIIYYKMYL